MSSEAGITNMELPDAYYRRLFSLIPARSLRSVVSELSSVWCEATGAEAVYLGVFEGESQKLTAGLFHSDQQNETECFIKESIQVANDCPINEQALSVFEQGRSFQLISQEPFDFFSIPGAPNDLAGIFLFSPTRLTEDLPLISQLIQLSQRLLVQVIELRTRIDPACVESESIETERAQTDTGQTDLVQTLAVERRIFPSTDKLEAMAEFAAGAGHEINNPVATIVGRVQMLLKGETDPDRRQSLATIGGQAYRVRDMIGDAMLFARPPDPRPVSLNIQSVTQEVLSSLSREISQSGVQVSIEISDLHSLWADEIQCKVVLSNLILNSLNVLESGGRVRIVSEEITTDSQRVLQIRVIDDGPGLTEEEKEHLFDPFYSARQAGRGLGFGLSKCWRILSLHGGLIEAENNVDCGVTFHLFWPVENPAGSSIVSE
ncbi:ATP-binding protein [uncultured Gimesia sp.]|uniref:sensor histidine kinase n=1 Tax=uncultured Gimesia sp. TaxID=1678688 RepID=UPI00261D3A83|nr:ATP-binding protein [uncultured Gimesia sp.]